MLVDTRNISENRRERINSQLNVNSVHLHLEYCVLFWHSFFKKSIANLVNTQGKVNKMIKEGEYTLKF